MTLEMTSIEEGREQQQKRRQEEEEPGDNLRKVRYRRADLEPMRVTW
jgi:hypothetical protein